jgi:hypothetical protein
MHELPALVVAAAVMALGRAALLAQDAVAVRPSFLTSMWISSPGRWRS